MDQQNVAQFLVSCLRAEGVKYVFGIPGEENIKFVRAVAASGDIRFILARHEQGASFMADIYGRLTGKAGVCTATLGPGAINLRLGAADAQTNSSPLVSISAQVGLKRIYKIDKAAGNILYVAFNNLNARNIALALGVKRGFAVYLALFLNDFMHN